MLKRLYADNYKCFVNFEFKMDEDEYYQHSALFIGKNGAGKTTFMDVLRIFQSIGRGQSNLLPLTIEENRPPVPPLVEQDKFSFGKTDKPMRFEIEVEISGHIFVYTIELELPSNFIALRVRSESLKVDGKPRFTRTCEKVTFSDEQIKTYTHDWHSIYLPHFQNRYSDLQYANNNNFVDDFKKWLGSMVTISPVPGQMRANLQIKSSHLQKDGANLPDWFAELIERQPDAYSRLKEYLGQVFPDFKEMRNKKGDNGASYLHLEFTDGQSQLSIRFDSLSDGERCLILAAVIVMAINSADEALLCFWDEPDNYLAISEVEYFIATLKKNFLRKGQIIVTTHNPETVIRFPEDNTFIFHRDNHLSHTRNLKTVEQWRKDANFEGDFITAWTLGDVES